MSTELLKLINKFITTPAEIKGSSGPGPIHPQASYSSRVCSLTLQPVGARVPGPQRWTQAPFLVSGTSSKALLGASAPRICLTLFSSCCLAYR